MQEYPKQAPSSKPDVFELTPYNPRHRKHLAEWVTNALAGILPWSWSLGARLGRTWHRNKGGFVNGVHSQERRIREDQCKAHVALLERRNWYRRCEQLPAPHRQAFRAVLLQARRLITDGEWWKERSYVDPATGEVKQTVYLPEDTWSPQTALAWCVSFLERFHAAARGMAEGVTPAYRPRETETGPEARRGPERVGDWLARAQARWCGPPGVQPELPATT
jgi:hypothetical protein